MSAQEQPLLAIVQDAVAAVFRRWKLILGTYLGILATVALGLFVIPPTYRAAGKILLTTDRAQVSASGDRSTELVRTNEVDDGEMISQLQILRSRELVDGVLERDGARHVSRLLRRPSRCRWCSGCCAPPRSMVRGTYRRLHGLDDLQGDDPLYWRTRGVLEPPRDEQPAAVEHHRRRPSRVPIRRGPRTS